MGVGLFLSGLTELKIYQLGMSSGKNSWDYVDNSILMVAVGGLLMVVLFVAGNIYYQQQLKRQLQVFSSFFGRATANGSLLDLQKIQFPELRAIGEYANDLLAKKREQESELEWLVYHDSLTTLPNRLQYSKALKQACERARLSVGNSIGAVVVIDFDNFKYINDTYGHSFGDQVLVWIGQRLLIHYRDYKVARLGDDEFALILERLKSEQEILATVRQMMAMLSKPLVIQDKEINLSFSVGLAFFPKHTCDPGRLLQFADVAVYTAKARGKNRFEVYSDEMYEQVLADLDLEKDLKNAVLNHEFNLHYQPIYQIENGLLKGFEALIRWEKDGGQVITPDRFIPLAEKTGLIYEIGRWVIQESYQFLQEINQKRPQALTISINISAVQLMNANFLADIKQLTEQYQVNPAQIVLEITETALMESFAVIQEKLKQMQQLGFKIALDDFGTGYSSLNYLMKLPVNYIKLDKSFVDEILKDPRYQKMNQALIDISHYLQLEVVAEGVEHEEQYRLLKEMGCDYVQGYLKGKPVAQEQISVYIR